MQCGIPVELMNGVENGLTGLHNLVFRGNLPAIKMLLDYGVDINVRDAKGYFPIQTAVIAIIPILPRTFTDELSHADLSMLNEAYWYRPSINY